MWSYIFLGILQGIFEWIPISSEGIVALATRFLIEKVNPLDIAIFLHLGTLFAVLIYFRKDWQKIFAFKNIKLTRFLIISTFVSLIVGLPVYKIVRNMAIGNTLLMITGFGLLFTAYFHKKKINYKLNFDQLALVTGFLQGLAIIPGLSRSGSTIFGLSLGKLSPAKTLKVSYMMSAPVILVSSVYLSLNNPAFILKGWLSLLFSFLVGILSLHFLIKLAQRINFFQFALIFSLLCFLGAIVGR